MADWSPDLYLKFADERTRAARDLLAQVPLAAPKLVYDLGCGPGNSTQLLVDAFSGAAITGIDSSAAMIEQARRDCPGAAFAQADLASWMPERPPDLLFSNAAFQWVPGHLAVIERLSAALPRGGVLAVQMPDNLGEPSHRLMQTVAEQGPWAAKLAGASGARDPLPSPQAYYARLKPAFARLDIWHTIYNHPLKGAAGIVAWVKSTGLRPYLDPLDEAGRRAFLDRYTQQIAAAYPANPDGTVLLRFPRLFMVAVK